ncbi:common central domain of tyrosinase-domain-containing protein [Chaetomium fimeti]|uniref:tyrosinase n=1 Tax=Chaetomium fimeti TaxID=1854472 RepID=A0AAE0HH01_9PEZI|nr:common central domain of tyrosinase-domain-containing protein [Chaetomium fimeti]
MATEVYVITGIKAGVVDNKPPLRFEVDTWYQPDHKKQTKEQLIQNSLFIWALKAFEEKDPTTKLSFFSVAGIHGYPYQPWDEADYTAATAGAGYCTHDSILFPCWHRPYILLYEQALYEIMMKELIPEVPGTAQEEWKAAANTWRLPYWDWAQKKTRPSADGSQTRLIYDVPLIAKWPRISVVDYRQADVGVIAEIDNPMYKFTMPLETKMGSYGINDLQDMNADNQLLTTPFSKSQSSSRWATFEPQGEAVSANWVDGTVNNDRIAEALEAHPWYNNNADGVPLAEMVYRLYEPEYVKSFAQFATTRFPQGQEPDPKAYLNLEFIHNNIHNWTGGLSGFTGHMGQVPVAGFDPIFFMHHCNVDRQFALWQALNEQNAENWFDNLQPPYDDDGTWNIPPETIDTPQTALAPFHKNSQGDFFNSDDVRKWIPLGYSYPELQPWLDKYKAPDGAFDYTKYVEDIRNQLKVLYQPPTSPTLRESVKSDIIVNVTYDRFAFNGLPYTIYLFVGDKAKYDSYRDANNQRVPPHKHPQHVGFVYTFSNPIFGTRTGGRGCNKCQAKSQQNTRCRGQIPITAALVARAGLLPGTAPREGGGPEGIHPLPNLDRDQVNEYLRSFLHWNVKTAGGTDVAVPAEDAFIEVVAYHRAARLDDRSVEPYRPLEGATLGKPGGIRSGGSSV